MAYPSCVVGGGKGIRTPDLLHAMQALYQLSYTPINNTGSGHPQRI
jgi:hypothetical protein